MTSTVAVSLLELDNLEQQLEDLVIQLDDKYEDAPIFSEVSLVIDSLRACLSFSRLSQDATPLQELAQTTYDHVDELRSALNPSSLH